MMETDIVALIQGVGFPIAVAAWFMWRSAKQDKIIEKNTAVMQAVTDAIQGCPRR